MPMMMSVHNVITSRFYMFYAFVQILDVSILSWIDKERKKCLTKKYVTQQIFQLCYYYEMNYMTTS